MKKFVILLISIVSLSACKSKKSLQEQETLPKDISLKPENNMSQQQDRERLSTLLKEIETLASSETCTNAGDWRFSPIGSKPCGGPSSYIAYPIKHEAEILGKIQQFKAMQMAFNTKYNLMSDCRMVMPPAGIKCENGKAVLFQESMQTTEAQ